MIGIGNVMNGILEHLVPVFKKIIWTGFEPLRREPFTSIPGIKFSGCHDRRALVKTHSATQAAKKSGVSAVQCDECFTIGPL